MFIPASIVIFALIAFAVIYAGTAADAFETLNNVISDGVGWWYNPLGHRFRDLRAVLRNQPHRQHPIGT